MTGRENAARWCSTCDEWSSHEVRLEGNISAGEEVELVTCARCGTVADRRKLDPVELQKRMDEDVDDPSCG